MYFFPPTHFGHHHHYVPIIVHNTYIQYGLCLYELSFLNRILSYKWSRLRTNMTSVVLYIRPKISAMVGSFWRRQTLTTSSPIMFCSQVVKEVRRVSVPFRKAGHPAVL